MRVQAMRNRRMAAGAILIYVSLLVHAEEPAAEAEPAESGEEAAASITYDEIPGLVITGNSKTLMGKSLEKCRRVCTGEPLCKSFSYRADDRRCVVSQNSLSYDPDFEFMAKSFDLAKSQRGHIAYEHFDGLTYRPNGWLKTKAGVSKDECKDMCNKAGRGCKAITYRAHDRKCMLTADGFDYDTAFRYFEKNDPATKPQDIVRQLDPVSVWTQPIKPPKPASQNTAVLTMEIGEKNKQATANRLNASATRDHEKAMFAIERMQNETAAAVEETQERSKKKLEQMEEQFKKRSAEAMSKIKDKAKIQFAEQETLEKGREKRRQMYAEKERARKDIAKIRQDGLEKANQAEMDARGDAKVEAMKLRLTQKIQLVRDKMNYAAKREKRAKEMEEKDRQDRNKITEREGKSESIASNEMKKKESAMLASLEVRKKKSTIATKATVLKIEEQSNKRTKEIETKQMVRRKEQGIKLKAKAAAIELAAKKKADETSQKRQTDQLAQTARDEKIRELQSKIIVSNRDRDEAQGMVEVSEKKSNEDATRTMRTMVQNMKTGELNSKELNHKKIRAVKEDMQKRLRSKMRETKQKGARMTARILETTMKKTEPERNTTRKAIFKNKEDYTNISASWAMERPYLKDERVAARVENNQLLKDTKQWRRDEIDQAKWIAKEIVHKAKKETDNIAAMGEAKADTMQAEGTERNAKIPKQRAEIEKSLLGMESREILCDVGAYVDSGPAPTDASGQPTNDPFPGLNSVEYRKRYIDDKIKYNTAKSLADEEAEELIITEKRTKVRLVDVARTLQSENNASLALWQRTLNETNQEQARLDNEIANLALSSPSQITTQMNALKDNSPYAQFLTVPTLNLTEELGEGRNQEPAHVNQEPADVTYDLNLDHVESLLELDAGLEAGLSMDDMSVSASDFTEQTPGSRCEGAATSNSEDKNLQQCKDLAASRGHKYFSFKSSQNLCKTAADCKKSNNADWAIYFAPSSAATRDYTQPYGDNKRCNGATASNAEKKNLQHCKESAASLDHKYFSFKAETWECKTAATCTQENSNGWAVYEETAPPTGAPTPIPPTPPPTYNSSDPSTANAIRQVQGQINELAQKNQGRVALMRSKQAAIQEATDAQTAYLSAINQSQVKYDMTVRRVNLVLEIRHNTSESANTTLEEATVAKEWGRGNLTVVMNNPANTAWGQLPEEAEREGELRLQAGGAREQIAYVQFPVKHLGDNRVVVTAHLKMYKFGGPGGPLSVYAASCQWSRGTLTYVKALNMPYARVSRGINAKIPDAEKVWFSVELKGDVIQNARLAGDHICLAVKGGPSAEHAVISSEVTEYPPKLDLELAETNQESFGRRPPVKPRKLKTAHEYCKEKVMNEIRAEQSKKHLLENRNEASQKVLALKKAETTTNAAKDVLGVMDLQVQGAEMQGQMMAQQAASIQASAQKIAAQSLTAMANNGASVEEIQVAKANMQQQAAEEASIAARAQGAKVEREAQSGLSTAEDELEKISETRRLKLDEKLKAIREKGKVLTKVQRSQVDAEVETKYAERATECAAYATSSSAADAGAPATLRLESSQLETQSADEVQLIELYESL